MESLLALGLLLAAPDSDARPPAFGLHEARLPVFLDDGDGEGAPPRDRRVRLTFVQRFSVADGDLGDDLDYEDLFETGYGFSFEFAYLMPAGLGWRYGPYVDFGWDFFGGGEETVGGVVIDADPLAIFNALVGLKAAIEVDEVFFLEFRFGVGLSWYTSTDVDLGPVPMTAELIESSAEVAGETGLRAGFNLGKVMVLDFGFGARLRGGAEGGDFGLDPGTMAQYFIDLGVGVRF